jgi:hypothetical protein
MLQDYLFIPEDYNMITSEQVRAARGLIRWEQKDLSAASGISLPAIKRLEQLPGPLAAQSRTVEAIIAAFEKAGVEFTNGGRPGVRLVLMPIISPVKDGTYEIKIPIVGGAFPAHVLPYSFPTEEKARTWLLSPDGETIVEGVREKYRRPK